jgi:glutathione S-transferase
MPQQSLPVLLVEGKRLSQSAAIASFLGHRFGLAGRSDWEQARVDEAVQTFRDFYGAVHDYLEIMGGFKQGNAVSFCSIFKCIKNLCVLERCL